MSAGRCREDDIATSVINTPDGSFSIHKNVKAVRWRIATFPRCHSLPSKPFISETESSRWIVACKKHTHACTVRTDVTTQYSHHCVTMPPLSSSFNKSELSYRWKTRATCFRPCMHCLRNIRLWTVGWPWNWGLGHSRSSKVTPFDSLGMFFIRLL